MEKRGSQSQSTGRYETAVKGKREQPRRVVAVPWFVRW
jgi:hypothetical protein